MTKETRMPNTELAPLAGQDIRHSAFVILSSLGFRNSSFSLTASASQIRARPARRLGFTLIELVISSALMTLILASAYLCLSSGLSSQKLIESRAEIAQSARVALARLTADLRGACPLSKDIAFLGMQRML